MTDAKTHYMEFREASDAMWNQHRIHLSLETYAAIAWWPDGVLEMVTQWLKSKHWSK